VFEIRKATRKRAKARIGISGASGSGKTYSSLLIAFGLCSGKRTQK
jgi:uridine kinase